MTVVFNLEYLLSVHPIAKSINEETHYYPFGLTMAGISSKAAGKLENRFKFNDGNELQSKEFSDGSGLEMYDATNRMYDPQIGRFGQIDELGEVALGYSPYSFSYNNPIRFNDPLGLEGEDFTGRDRKKEKRTEGTGAGNEQEVLANVTVTARHTTQNLKNTYWNLRSQGVSFDNIKDRGLRNWFTNYDKSERGLHQLHLKQREDEMAALEIASYLLPAGELVIAARLGRAAFGIFKLKRGIHVISGVSDLTAQLLSTKGDLSKINLANTISSTLIGNPILNSIPGSVVQLSYENLREGKLVQSYSDPNVIKGIVVGSMGSYFGAKYGVSLARGSTLPGGKLIGESIFATTAAVYDKMTPF